MAVEFDGGVVIGADSRTTTGYEKFLFSSIFNLIYYLRFLHHLNRLFYINSSFCGKYFKNFFHFSIFFYEDQIQCSSWLTEKA